MGSQPTFPKMLRDAGYTTAVIGKWHLVSDPTGFDHWEVLPGQGIYYNPPMIRNGEKVTHHGYVTDIISDLSLEWLENRDKSKPFLLMSQHRRHIENGRRQLRHLGWTMIGSIRSRRRCLTISPAAARPSAITGWDLPARTTTTMPSSRPRAALTLSSSKCGTPTTSRAMKSSGKRSSPQRPDPLAIQPYMHDYLGTVKAFDEAVGKLLDYLDREKLADNTLV